MSTMIQRDVETPSGVFHLYEAGSGGPALILIHGGTASGKEWWPTLDAMGDQIRCISPDRLGCGESSRARTGYTWADQARSINELAAALDLDRPILVGQSLGGLIAMHTVLAEPARWRGAVLVDAAGAPMTDEERAARRARPQPPAEQTVRERAQATAEACFYRHERIPAGHVDLITWQMERADPAIGEALRASFAADAPIPYEQIAVPTLVVWGQEDELTPVAGGERLAQRIPNAKLLVIPDCGHLPQYEQPGAFHPALLAFARSL